MTWGELKTLVDKELARRHLNPDTTEIGIIDIDYLPDAAHERVSTTVGIVDGPIANITNQPLLAHPLPLDRITFPPNYMQKCRVITMRAKGRL